MIRIDMSEYMGETHGREIDRCAAGICRLRGGPAKLSEAVRRQALLGGAL